MNKVKITASGLMSIVQNMLSADDINVRIVDGEYAGQTLQEVLNVEYYAFKHRPQKSEQVIFNIVQQGGVQDTLQSIKRSFCLFSIIDTQRLYSKDIDNVAVSATLEYHIQTSKVPFLEELVENFNLQFSGNGVKVPVEFDTINETRMAFGVLGKPQVMDIQTTSLFGEIAVVEISLDMTLQVNCAFYGDYTMSFSFVDSEDIYQQDIAVPLSSFSYSNIMTQKSLPQERQNSNVANINLSRGLSFTLVFDGYDNAFINYLRDLSLSASERDINQLLVMKVQKGEQSYTHNVIIKDHSVQINNDNSNEVHTLTLVTQFSSIQRTL